MATPYLKKEKWNERTRQRKPAGLIVVWLAILFTITCIVATVVMLLG